MKNTSDQYNLEHYGLKFQHIGLIVDDVNEAAKFFSLIPGVSSFRYLEASFEEKDMRVGIPSKIISVLFKIGDLTYEFVQATDGPHSYQAKAAEVRNGFHHVAYSIENEEVFAEFVKNMKDKYTVVWAADFGDCHGYYFAPKEGSGMVLEISNVAPELEPLLKDFIVK